MTKMVRFDPFAELYALQKQLMNDDWPAGSKGMTMPTTDVYMQKDDSELIVEAHLPNFAEEDIDVHIEDGTLVIQAEKTEKEEDKEKKKYFVRESSNSFYRTVRLPERADAEAVEAHFEDGVLKVVVPIKETPKPKKISVKKTSGTSKKSEPTKKATKSEKKDSKKK